MGLRDARWPTRGRPVTARPRTASAVVAAVIASAVFTGGVATASRGLPTSLRLPTAPVPAAVRRGATTTTTSASPTTIAGIAGRVPTAPRTVPLRTHATSAHVDPVLARIAESAFGLFVVLLLVQFLLTRPGRRGRRTL